MGNNIRRFLVSVGLGMLLLTGIDGYGQNLRQHNWYFGNTQRAIRFNRVTNVSSLVTDKAVPFGTGGSAVATDRGNGNLLFYTDGDTIYDANHTHMPGGIGLNGNVAANQPVAICPVPGQDGKYFVFTNNANFTTGGTISYTIVDMKLFGTAAFPSPPRGDVESKNTALPGLVGLAEGMITLPHDNKRDFWLITQNVNTRVFNATLINALSYTANTFTTVSSNVAAIEVFPTTIAHFAYHDGLKKIAAAPQDASTNALVLGFNEANGAISFDDAVTNSAVVSTTTQAIYDVEWSQGGRYLYLSRHGEAGITADVLQYDYQNSSITLRSVLSAPIFRSYGLQRGPDTLIYHMYQSASGGPFLLGRIEHPDSVAAKAQYNPAPGPFAALNFTGKQFSTFLPKDTVALEVDFTFAGTCMNSPTTFFPEITPNADSLQWDLGDGNVTSAWSPIHTYTAAGSVAVTLRAFYQGQEKTKTNTVVIRSFSLQIQLVQDTTACRDEFPPKRGTATPANQFSVPVKIQGGTPTSILWSNLDTGPNLTPDSAGFYYVVVSDNAGCSGYAPVTVREYGLQSQFFNKWYFGNKAGIDFSRRPAPVALNESVMDAPEGCAIACDENGTQLFYTDGSTVWNKTHTVVATNIGGNPLSGQSALVVPVPDDITIWYIFTTQDADNGTDLMQLTMSMYDIKANAGMGGIVEQSVVMYVKTTERITATEQWLIVHDFGNSTFRVYPITAEGLGNPVFTDGGANHSIGIPQNQKGYIKIGARNTVAVPLSTPGVSNKIEVFHLNDTTLMLTNYKSIDLNDVAGTIYGTEFSPAGNKLYVSVLNGGSSSIYEYSLFADIPDGDPIPEFRPFDIEFKQKIPVASEIGAIQIAPNGQVLVATNSAGTNTSLGAILPNEEITELSTFQLNGFQLAGGTNSRLGLPNFAQISSIFPPSPGLTVTPGCGTITGADSDSTRFVGTGRDPNIEEYRFRVFRNGTLVAQSPTDKKSLYNPNFTAFLPPGDYQVTLQLHNRCDTDISFSQDFTVNGPPVNPSAGVPLCNSPTAQLDANPGNVAGLTYLWLTGETTEILTVDDQGLYAVQVSDARGCKTIGQFIVADSRPIFDLGPDITICEGVNTPSLNANNPGMTYAWTINTVPASTSSVQGVDTDTPGIFDYQVTVTDPVTNCFRTEDKEYTINVSPALSMSGISPLSCGTPTGSITLTVSPSAPNAGPYSYFISGPGGSQSDIDKVVPPLQSFTLSNVTAGTYSGIVQDQVSGCTSQAAFGLNDAVFTLGVLSNAPNCDPVILGLTVSTVPTPPTFPLTYTTTNSATGATTTGTSGTAAFNTTTGLPAGDYVIEVKDAGNCTVTTPHTITPNPELNVTLVPDLCALTLTATGGTTYTWSASPANGLVVTPPPGPTATVNLRPDAGIVTYTVKGEGAAACPHTESITLNVGNIPVPAITQTTACAETAIMNATPVGTFNYRWYVNGSGTPDPTLGGSAIPLTLANDGTSYEVEIFEPVSGCTRKSIPFVAHVFGVVDASLASTPPCNDDQPITLTAATVAIGATFSWTRDGTPIAGVTTPITQQTAEGRYQVIVTKGTCSATAELQISRAALPEGELPNIAIICDDPENNDPETASVDLDPGSFISYDWLKNGITLSYTNRVFTADSKGTYEVKITDAARCSNIDKTEVLNECVPVINGPNAFKPGSTVFNPDRKDLTNSDFWVFTRFIDEDQFKVFIFNRWGEMVYSSTDRFFKWNGGYNNDANRPAPPGTYSYVVQYVSAFRPSEGVKEKRGGVALIR